MAVRGEFLMAVDAATSTCPTLTWSPPIVAADGKNAGNGTKNSYISTNLWLRMLEAPGHPR
jgi:hypothetical protein